MVKPKAEGSASARKTASKKKTNRNVKAPRGNVNSGRVNRREKLHRKTVNKKKNNSRKVSTGRAGVNNGRKQPSGKTGKRTGYLPWEDYFMSLAFVSGDRSKDNRTQVGACIVNSQKRIVGLGYNGMPNGLSDDKFPWRQWKEGDDILQSKNPYVCHAEMNAVVNKNQADIRGCKMYVSLYPCNECAKIIIQSGITEVIYYSDKNLRKVMADKSTQKNPHKAIIKATRKMFTAAKVKCRKYKGSRKKVDIPFESINKEKRENSH